MAIKIGIMLACVIALFLTYVATRSGAFRYERSGLINAPAETIFPYISDLHRGVEWSPYEQKDPNMKKYFSGPEIGVGSKMVFEGSSDAGTGSLETLRLEPNREVAIRLVMTKPMAVDHVVTYTLTPESGGTRFSWAMTGEANYLIKLIGVFVDCETFVSGDMEKGIANLKGVLESRP